MKTTTPEQRAKDGGRFLIGHTSEQLKQANVDDYDIYFGNSKIAKILLNLEMTPQIIKEVADVVERPIIVMDSKTVPGSITMFGESRTGNGKPVMVSMLLHPTSKTGEILDYGVVTSAYGRRTSNAQNLIDTSNIRYIDPDEKRTGDWMKTLGLQLPSVSSVTDSITSMPENGGKVKGENATKPLLRGDAEINTEANARTEAPRMTESEFRQAVEGLDAGLRQGYFTQEEYDAAVEFMRSGMEQDAGSAGNVTERAENAPANDIIERMPAKVKKKMQKQQNRILRNSGGILQPGRYPAGNGTGRDIASLRRKRLSKRREGRDTKRYCCGR